MGTFVNPWGNQTTSQPSQKTSTSSATKTATPLKTKAFVNPFVGYTPPPQPQQQQTNNFSASIVSPTDPKHFPQPAKPSVLSSAKSILQNLGVTVGKFLQKVPDPNLGTKGKDIFKPTKTEEQLVNFISNFPSAIAQSYGKSLEMVSTPDGRKQIAIGAKDLPKTMNEVKGHIERKEWAEALNTAFSNPALSVGLDVADFIPFALIANKSLKASKTLLKQTVEQAAEEALEKAAKTTTKEVTNLVKKSTDFDPQFKKQLDSLGTDNGWEIKHGPVKTVERASEKALNDYGGDVTRIKDLNRSTIIAPVKDSGKVIGQLKKEFEVTRIKEVNNSGFQTKIVNVKTPHGQAEIQVTTPAMFRARKELGGHELYKQIRNQEGDWEKAEQEMKKLYSAAAEEDGLKSATALSKAASSTSSPSTNALNGGNGLPNELTPNTSLVEGSRSTLTGTSSTMKNLGNKTKPPSGSSIPESASNVNKVSKLGLRVEQTAVEKKLTKELGDLPDYKQMNMKDQAKMAADLIKTDEDRALRIALGQEEAPKGLLPQSVFKAMEGSITTPEMARKLATSPLVSEASALGQKIKALDVGISDSPVEAMKQVVDARTKAIEKKLGKTVDKATEQVVKDIKSKTKAPDKYDWKSFVESIKC